MRAARSVALASYLALIVVIVLWEGWLAPPTPAPRLFWLGLKLAPLVLPLYGMLRAKPKTYIVAALIVLLYFTEGVMLAYSAFKGTEGRGVLAYALAQTALAIVFFVGAAFYSRFRNLGAAVRARESVES